MEASTQNKEKCLLKAKGKKNRSEGHNALAEPTVHMRHWHRQLPRPPFILALYMTPSPGLEFISPSQVTLGTMQYEFHLMNEEIASKNVKLESYRIVCSETLCKFY